MRTRSYTLLLAAAFSTFTIGAKADVVLTVGPAGQYQTISDAVTAADADTDSSYSYDIQVAPGTYTNDFSEVTRPMTIEVDPNYAGSQVLLQATVPLPNEKGIILTFASLTVNGLTFAGAAIDNSLGGNGAGIRDQNTDPANLIVENSTFIGNQEGILTGYDSNESIVIDNSVFKNNGNPDQDYFQHALYVNYAGSLTVSNSLFCGQLIGHDIKSRALATTVVNNQIYDGAADPVDGCDASSSSYAIDTPNGGTVVISGNQIIKGAAAQNYTMVDYGAEGLLFNDNSLFLSDNAFINIDAPSSTGIYDPYCVPAQLLNNTFQGVDTPVDPPGCAVDLGASDPSAILGAIDPPAVPEPNGLLLLLSAIGGWAAAWQISSRSHAPRAW
jgi:hypothetical protein